MARRFFLGSRSSSGSSNGTHTFASLGRGMAGTPDSQVSRRELRQLKWLTALVPGTVVLIYESARQEALEHILPALPVQYGNFVVWVLVLLLTYAFAAFVFRIVERMRTVTDDLYQDVRESISELRTRVSERGLPATVREYVDEYEDRHGVTVK